MLVLSRKLSERIIVTTPEGREIVISLEKIGPGDKARIGIQADDDVTIHREEVQRAVEADRRRLGSGGGR